MTIGEQYRPLRDVVRDEIRARIINGVYTPGEHMVEDRLARELGVSRNPVREALRALEAERFIQLVPRKGAVVADLSNSEVNEVFEVREALEGLAAELAAAKADPEGIAELDRILAEASAALQRADRVRVVDLNAAFHDQVLSLAENGFLSAVTTQLRGRIKWIFSRTSGGVRGHHSLEEHDTLVTAIREGDVVRAGRLAREHVRAAADSYWATVDGGGQSGGPSTNDQGSHV